MSTVVNILIGLLIFSVIIIFHELGHLLLAKKNGIAVPEFSLGMGPRLCSFMIGETKYSIKLFWIGGMCQMLGEDEDSQDERAFGSKSVGARFSTVFAGPFFNFILAFILSIIVIGIVGFDSPEVLRVDENGAAQLAGLQNGDIITSFDGKSISIGRELASYFDFNDITDKPVNISYERDGKEYNAVLTPRIIESYRIGFNYNSNTTEARIISLTEGQPLHQAGAKAGDIITSVNGTEIKNGVELSQYLTDNPMTDEKIVLVIMRDGKEYTAEVTPSLFKEYDLGFRYNYNVRTQVGPLKVLKYSLIEVKYWITTTIKSVGKLITGQLSSNDIGGPVRIVSELGNTVQASKSDGIKYVILNLMNWAILLSANLGIMNLLPLPALDGGRLVFIILEAIRRKPIDKEKEGLVHGIGLLLLLALMVVVFFNDIKNVFI